MSVERITPAIEDRVEEVLMLLADRGQHLGPSIPDLLIAATAENASLTVLAADKHFELIAAITGQPVEALALRRPGCSTLGVVVEVQFNAIRQWFTPQARRPSFRQVCSVSNR